jgi:hypothetical protein
LWAIHIHMYTYIYMYVYIYIYICIYIYKHGIHTRSSQFRLSMMGPPSLPTGPEDVSKAIQKGKDDTWKYFAKSANDIVLERDSARHFCML